MQSEHDQSTRHVQEEGKIEPRSNDAFSDHDEQTSSSQLTTPDTLTSDTKSPGPDEGEWGVHNHMAHVTVKQPGPVKHQSAVSAYWRLVSGRLVADWGGSLFSTAAASEKPWNLKDDLPLLGSQTGVPKFLFRGFHAKSGGGEDARLNSWNGIIPHAFLRANSLYRDKKGKLINMWEIQADWLYDIITLHIENYRRIESPFSSWTHTLETALKFALENDSSTIAVVDTSHASLVDRVWYTEDLNRADLTATSFPDEFLVYGPVSGPNYHCISVRDLVNTTRIRDIIDSPPTAFGNDRVSCIERGAVEASRQIATALQPPDASLENIVILTARFVGVRAAKFMDRLDYLGDPELKAFLYYVRDDLQRLALRLDARYISLSDKTMDTCFSAALEFEVQMLQAAENVVRVLAWDRERPLPSSLTATAQDQLEDTVNTDYVEEHVRKGRHVSCGTLTGELDGEGGRE
ncbi:hypothetical protein INS49_013667 [Diaporthe citri]|uniref:uncharacterized protein n=1 Tax=Diaporthe citri TaxID=83186 RepID=UPI001C801F7A|nr:uncharacterized protein INS49_013667 [Diaporthe citri]KAG6357788.1 hypothetical protein INS49_013667 [Diaporthe citri]